MLRFVNIGLKNILFRVSFFRIEIFTFFIVFAVNLQKIGLLNRFPWQDLIYSDFQIYNKWRWFKDSLNQLGIFYGLSNSIDFTRNFGENTYLTSRTASPLFDLGSIGYEITGNLQIAIVFKSAVYLLALLVGLYCLQKLLFAEFSGAPLLLRYIHIFIFVIVGCHPIFYHEIGPMVLWYLFITPAWLYLFLKLCQTGNIYKFLSSSVVPLYLTLGSGDLFLFFYFPTFIIFSLVFFRFQKKTLQVCLIALIYLETILFIYYLNYFLMSNNIDNVVHHGTVSLEVIVKSFLAPLFIYTPFLPYFVGPVTLFVNIFAIVIYLWAFSTRKLGISGRNVLLFITLLQVYLVSLVIAFHGISFIRSRIPSGFRYHFAADPIFIMVMLIFVFSSQTARPMFVKIPKFMTVLIVLLLATSLSEPYVFGKLIPSTSKHIVSPSLGRALLSDLPGCIIGEITHSKYNNLNRSFFFATNRQDAGRNDTLTYLIENGIAVGGRTFTQWEYATNKANFLLNRDEGLGGLQTYTLTIDDVPAIKKYMERSFSPFLLSTSPVSDKELYLIGSCNTSKNFKQIALPFRGLFSGNLVGNSSLLSNIYIYTLKNMENIAIANYRSSNATFTISCSPKKDLVMPVNYTNQVGVLVNNVQFTPTRSSENFVKLDAGTFPCTDKALNIYIYSHSWLNFVDLYLLIYLVLTFLFSQFRRKYLLDN